MQVQTTPCGVNVEPGRTVTLIVEKNGYEPARRTLNIPVSPSAPMSVTFELRRADPEIGSLRVLSFPSSATVSIDGAMTNADQAARGLAVAAGQHHVRVGRPGYFGLPGGRSIRVPPRREVTCRFLLVPWRLRLGWVAPLVLLLALAGQHLFVAGHRIPLDMVYFAPGQYKRGGEETPLLNLIRRYIDVVSDLEAFFEEPPQTIKIEAFLIDPNEVTNKDFGRFLESGEVRAKEPVINDEPAAEDGFVPSHWQDSRFNGADQPVVGVDWHVAAAYCRWLDKRLPSGDEWERAARGTTGRLFPWGNDFDPNAANTGESPERAAVSVGRYAGDLSPDGVHDMAGNVREWTLEERQIGDRPGRVIRGAAWNSTGEVYGLAHVKFAAEPAYRSVSLGFRCARNAGQSAEVPSGMVFVPGGTFKRGSEESVTLRLARRFNMSTAALERLIGEKPFEVDLAGFAIDALEVTNADYRRFLEAGDGRDD